MLAGASIDEGRDRRWAGSFALVVLEKHVRLFPALSGDALRPLYQGRRVIIESMESEISPRRGAHNRNLEVFLFGDAHRDVPLAHRVVDLFVEPALVPELEHVAAIGRQQSEESAKTGHILFQVGRQLKKYRAQTVAEHRGVLAEKIKEIRGLLLEPRAMRDALARLQGESERLRDLRRPVAQHVLPRQPVERVIDLDRREFAGVIAQESVVLQISRIELSLPLLERVAARPGQNLHD